MGERPRVVKSNEGATFEMPGEVFTGKLTGAHTGDRIAMGVDRIAPKHGTTKHRHMRSAEIFYVVSGSITIEIEDDEFQLNAGDVAYAPPGAAHRMTNTSRDPADVMGMFLPAGPEKGLRALGELMVRTNGNPSPEELETALAQGDQVEVEPARMKADA